MPLERVAAFNDAVSRSARFIGAPLGGVLIALLGTNNVLWVDAATFLVSALLIAVCVPRTKQSPPGEQPKRYATELLEGLRFIRRDRVILTFIWVVLITNLLDAAMGSVIMPIYVSRVYGDPAVLGVISGLTSGAAFVCAMVIGARGVPRARRLALGVTFTITGTRFWLLALSPSLPALLFMFTGIGLCVGFINPILSAVELERIPASMRARVFGVITAGVMVAMPLAGLSGPIVEQIGLTPTLLILGTCYVVTTGSLLFNPVLREIDKPARKMLAPDSATS
jgi:predicted MFS family arabinose efflux permease